jgi:hypothetical protein
VTRDALDPLDRFVAWALVVINLAPPTRQEILP